MFGILATGILGVAAVGAARQWGMNLAVKGGLRTAFPKMGLFRTMFTSYGQKVKTGKTWEAALPAFKERVVSRLTGTGQAYFPAEAETIFGRFQQALKAAPEGRVTKKVLKESWFGAFGDAPIKPPSIRGMFGRVRGYANLSAVESQNQAMRSKDLFGTALMSNAAVIGFPTLSAGVVALGLSKTAIRRMDEKVKGYGGTVRRF